MLPTAPLPDGLSRKSHFSQIISVHHASIFLRLRSIKSRGQTMVFRSPFDLPGNFGRNPAQTIQQHVSVAQQGKPQSIATAQVPASEGNFCDTAGRFGPHATNEEFGPPFYQKIV